MPSQNGQIEIEVLTDRGGASRECLPDIARQLWTGLQVDRQRVGSKSALRVVNRQKPQGTAPRILRPGVSQTLVPPA